MGRPVGRCLAILATGAALSAAARAGENFTTFIKSADMSGAYFLSYDGSPTNFPWDGSGSSTLNTPFADLKNNGLNYVRLNVWQSTTNDTQGLNMTQMLQLANVAKKTYGLKLYIDAIPADGGQTFGSCPAEWAADYDSATDNGQTFTVNSTTSKALEADVKNWYAGVATALANQGTPADIISIGNEINNTFVGVPSKTPLFYELVYKGAAGVKSVDSSIAVMLHLHDIGSDQWTECYDLANCNSIPAYGTPSIDFDVFGFSFHAFDNPLYNPNWSGSDCSSSNGETIGLKNAFQSENLGQFTNETTGNPDSGKPIYLMVAETAWAWTGTPETVNGTSYGLAYTSTSQFVQDNTEFTFYNLDASGYRQYLEDEMTDVSGMADGLGKGVNAWAASVITGWGSHHDEYNFAFWDSASGDLKTSSSGAPMINAFLPNY